MKLYKLAIFSILFISSISTAQAKQVTVCSAYVVGATAKMNCSGFKTKETFSSLYRRGWSYAGDISGTSGKFILIFEK